MQNLPDKREFRVGEVCQYTDTQPYVLRFWESEFPQLAPHKNESGQRVYSRGDVELILRIKRLLYEEECTIEGARKRLQEEHEAWTAGGDEAAEQEREGEEEPASPAPPRRRALAEEPPLFHSTSETVERERYDNAVREIQRLRAEVKGLTEVLGEQKARVREVERKARERRERTAAAVQRLEALLERLTGSGPDA